MEKWNWVGVLFLYRFWKCTSKKKRGREEREMQETKWNKKVWTSKNWASRSRSAFHSVYSLFYFISVTVYDGETLSLMKISRLEMGAYLCIASNGVPPSVSKRIIVDVECKSLDVSLSLLLLLPARSFQTSSKSSKSKFCLSTLKINICTRGHSFIFSSFRAFSCMRSFYFNFDLDLLPYLFPPPFHLSYFYSWYLHPGCLWFRFLIFAIVI